MGTHTPRRDPQHPCPPPRRVWIEKESINSVAISDSPEALHQRVLVAASLSVNATGECGHARPAPPAPWGSVLGWCRPVVWAAP